MNCNWTQNALFKLCLSQAAGRKQSWADESVCLTVGRVLHHDWDQISTGLFWQMISVADKETQLVKLETFKGVQDHIDGLSVNIFEVSDFGNLNFLFFLRFSFVDSYQRLITFKLLEESGGWAGDDWDDSDDFLHDLVLDKDISLGFDDLDVHVVILWLIYDWVLAFWVDFRQRHHASDPRVFRVSQRFYAFNVRIEFSFILGVEVWKVFRLI